MKKLLLSFVLMFAVAQMGTQLSAQSKAAADALKSLDKAKAETANPKKAASPLSWIKLSAAYDACYDAPIKGMWQGASQMETKMILKDQPILKSQQVEKNGDMYSVDSYSDKDVYYNESGVLAGWIVTRPTLQEEDALALSLQALDKAVELDSKGAQAKPITDALIAIQNRLQNEAMSNYTLKDFKEASILFEKSWAVSKHPLVSNEDTVMMYYGALTASWAGDVDRSIKLLEYCESVGFCEEGDIYSQLSKAYKSKEEIEKSKSILEVGFEKYPTNQAILVDLINLYMESKEDPDKLLSILKVAQENEPNNASLVYAEGTLYKNLNKFDEAVACFRRASEVDPTYVYAPFAEGCAFYDLAVEIQDKAQSELDDTKYNELLKQIDEALESALAPFEKGFEIAQDKDIKVACAEYLKNIYFRNREKSSEAMERYEMYNKFVLENR